MSQKYQREIEEILQQVDTGSSPKSRIRQPGLFSRLSASIKRAMGGNVFSISPGRIMFAAVCLLLSALVVSAFIPGYVGPIAWAGLVLFIVGYAMFFIKPRTSEKRWRGQPIEDNERKWFGRK
ncbi:MAG: hypothetical protein FJ319_10045 [SAR202 cluster bacterium]|nr:hypothetical protein [SAR202 cluster bacterium]